MPAKTYILIAMLLFGLIAASGALAQETKSTAPPDVARWELICFCSTTVATPHGVVRMDNNGQILFAAQTPVTVTELRSRGLAMSDSQIRLLRDWRLLREERGLMFAAIPLLGPEQMAPLRARLRERASHSVERLLPQMEKIKLALQERGRESATYAVVFSYVLDGVVWDRFDAAKLLPETEPTVNKPFWNGTFWAVYPKRAFVPGTNSGSNDSGYEIRKTWTDTMLQKLAPLQNREQQHALIARLRGKPAKLSAEVEAMQLFSADGKPQFAVIDEAGNDPIYAAGQQVAGLLSEDMQDWLKNEKIADTLRTEDRGQALLIAYHEYMWELLDQLVARGGIRVPQVLTDVNAPTSDIKDVIVVVKKAALTR